jgi:D-lactate dehydrogenase (cytochrome)
LESSPKVDSSRSSKTIRTQYSCSVTVKLAPVLPTTVAVVQFPDVQKATEAVADILNKGIGIRKSYCSESSPPLIASHLECIELCDDKFMHATNKFGVTTRKWAETDSLFIKLQGPSQSSLKESVATAKSITKTGGALGFEMAKNKKEAGDLWADRKNAAYARLALVPGLMSVATDV